MNENSAFHTIINLTLERDALLKLLLKNHYVISENYLKSAKFLLKMTLKTWHF